MAQSCGPHLVRAMLGSIAYQELLFPKGSMDITRGMYEEAVNARFYNECVVAAVEIVLLEMPSERRVTAIEIGAGTGGTTSSLLPSLQSVCSKYMFTDVSEVFLNQARRRFSEYSSFMRYEILNIDADIRLQGFASHSYDLAIATNVLHATPFIRNTLRNSYRLLCWGGFLTVNELLHTSSLVQISFGLTDGWWLFTSDPERQGQLSPLMSWEQWRTLLAGCGFGRLHCMRGHGLLMETQAIIVAQMPVRSEGRSAVEKGAHLLSGGMGGLGLLTARLLVGRGANRVVLTSRSGRVQLGSEVDWSWLCRSAANAQIETSCCDVSDPLSVRAVLSHTQRSGPAVTGVFHAAGLLADATIQNQTMTRFRIVFAPKVHGASILHLATAQHTLQLFHAYSSVAGLVGNAGAAPASAASAWLSSFINCRSNSGLAGHSVHWGDVSINAKAATGVAQLDSVPRTTAIGALRDLIAQRAPSVCVLSEMWPFRAEQSTREQSMGLLLPWKYRKGPSNSSPNMSKASLHTVDLPGVLSIVKGAMSQNVDPDVPLFDAGLDSLGAVEIRSQLQQAVGDGYAIPDNLLIDHPTARSIASALSGASEDIRGGRAASSPNEQASPYSALPSIPKFDFEPEYLGNSLVRLKRASGNRIPPLPPLIIAHSVVGDEQGFERWHKGMDIDREVLVLRHPALQSGKFSDRVSVQGLSELYCHEILGYLGERPFDLIGASLGAIIAHRVALLLQRQGGSPRRLVLIDPPEIGTLPGFLRLVAKNAQISYRMAAESLIIGPHIQLGGARDPESLRLLQGILDEVRTSPEHALAFILAKAGLSEQSTIAQTQQAVCQAAIRIQVHKQLIQLVWDEWSGRAPPAPRPFAFASKRGGPAIFMITASERGAFFGFLMTQGMRNIDDSVLDRMTNGNARVIRAQFAKYNNAKDFRQMLNEGSSLEMIRKDFGSAIGARALDSMNAMIVAQNDLNQYGPRAMELEVDGQHFDIVMRCISRRDEQFVCMCDQFLAPDSYMAESDSSRYDFMGQANDGDCSDATKQSTFPRLWRVASGKLQQFASVARRCMAATPLAGPRPSDEPIRRPIRSARQMRLEEGSTPSRK